MKASVVLVPFRNMASFNRTLKEINTKTDYKDYEIIVVDNNIYTDSKCEYCGNIIKQPKHDNIRYFLNSNKGALSGAMNIAISQAKSDYIVYVCANHCHIYSSDWLSYMIACMDHAGALWVLGGDLQPYGSMQHVQGGVFIGRRNWMLAHPYDVKKTPFSFMDVYISKTALRDKKRLLRIPNIHSTMNKFTAKNDRDNQAVKKFKIVHSHIIKSIYK